MRGLVERRVFEEGVNRGQPDIARPCADAAFLLEVVEEHANERSAQVFDRECRRGLLQAKLHELQEQMKGVAVARDGVRTRLPLAHQTIREERFEEPC